MVEESSVEKAQAHKNKAWHGVGSAEPRKAWESL